VARRNEVIDAMCSSASTTHDEKSSVGLQSTTCKGGVHGKVTSFIAPNLRIEPYKEVYGLRETLESSGDERHEDHEGKLMNDGNNEASGVGVILFHHINQRNEPEPALISPHLRSQLFQLYQLRVDSVYKVLHWPMVLSTIQSYHETSGDISNIQPD
jgi:hypothetical protein